jgi:quercetin dioxygenase-like cupin family protein
MNQTAIQAEVAVARAGEGEARWWWGNLAEIRLGGSQTNGGLTVIELTLPLGRMTPPHVHHREEETFLVTKGHVTFQIGEQTIKAEPGDLVVGPRDVPHRFKAGADGATVLLLLTPAGLEGLVREQSVPAARREPPAPDDAPPPDLAHMSEVAARYGCELLM